MIKVLQRTRVASDTKSAVDTKSITEEVYRVAFWAIVALATVVGIGSLAALGVGIAKAVLMIAAAI